MLVSVVTVALFSLFLHVEAQRASFASQGAGRDLLSGLYSMGESPDPSITEADIEQSSVAGAVPLMEPSITEEDIEQSSVAGAVPLMEPSITEEDIEQSSVAGAVPLMEPSITEEDIEQSSVAGAVPLMEPSITEEDIEQSSVAGAVPFMKPSFLAGAPDDLEPITELPSTVSDDVPSDVFQAPSFSQPESALGQGLGIDQVYNDSPLEEDAAQQMPAQKESTLGNELPEEGMTLKVDSDLGRFVAESVPPKALPVNVVEPVSVVEGPGPYDTTITFVVSMKDSSPVARRSIDKKLDMATPPRRIPRVARGVRPVAP